MPEEAWNVLEVSRLRRGIEDESYRDEVLREKGIVRPGHPFLSSNIIFSNLFCLLIAKHELEACKYQPSSPGKREHSHSSSEYHFPQCIRAVAAAATSLYDVLSVCCTLVSLPDVWRASEAYLMSDAACSSLALCWIGWR